MVDGAISGEPEPDLSGELALDLLTGPEKAHALRLQLSDPAFAKEVSSWRERLAPLFSEFEDVPAPATIWDAALPHFVGPTAQVKVEKTERRQIRFWKTIAISGGLIAASLAVALITSRQPSPAPAATGHASAVASLTGDIKAQLVTLVYDASAGTLRLVSAGLQPDRKSPELWAIPADGKPRSLGFFAPDGSSQLIVAVDRRRFMAPGITLAVTLEDRSTAPHDAPGSTPILTGKLTKL